VVAPRPVSAPAAALVGLAGLASAMGIGRFAFTPLLPLMQGAGEVTLAQGGALAGANYLGYLAGAVACTVLAPAPHRAAAAGLAAVAALTAAMGSSGRLELWLALRFLAGVASAFVLVGISAWALPLLAAQRRGSWSGWVYAGVGIGITLAGFVGLGAGLLRAPPSRAWLVLGACSAAVALAVWRPLAAHPSASGRGGAASGARVSGAWRPVSCYGAFGFGYIVPATFLPAAARQLVPDPAVFGWTWPVFGLAAAVSTVAGSRFGGGRSPRRMWLGAQLVMAAGVLAPAIRTSVPTLLFSAVCVGGTFMVVTMAGMQEARRIAGPAAPRLMAAMTAAFAAGQLAGPFAVRLLPAAAAGPLAAAHAVAAAVLLLATLLLAAPAPEPAAAPSLTHERDHR
jgi:predicted MFS family arabinose efflux permease